MLPRCRQSLQGAAALAQLLTGNCRHLHESACVLSVGRGRGANVPDRFSSGAKAVPPTRESDSVTPAERAKYDEASGASTARTDTDRAAKPSAPPKSSPSPPPTGSRPTAGRGRGMPQALSTAPGGFPRGPRPRESPAPGAAEGRQHPGSQVDREALQAEDARVKAVLGVDPTDIVDEEDVAAERAQRRKSLMGKGHAERERLASHEHPNRKPHSLRVVRAEEGRGAPSQKRALQSRLPDEQGLDDVGDNEEEGDEEDEAYASDEEALMAADERYGTGLGNLAAATHAALGEAAGDAAGEVTLQELVDELQETREAIVEYYYQRYAPGLVPFPYQPRQTKGMKPREKLEEKQEYDKLSELSEQLAIQHVVRRSHSDICQSILDAADPEGRLPGPGMLEWRDKPRNFHPIEFMQNHKEHYWKLLRVRDERNWQMLIADVESNWPHVQSLIYRENVKKNAARLEAIVNRVPKEHPAYSTPKMYMDVLEGNPSWPQHKKETILRSVVAHLMGPEPEDWFHHNVDSVLPIIGATQHSQAPQPRQQEIEQ